MGERLHHRVGPVDVKATHEKKELDNVVKALVVEEGGILSENGVNHPSQRLAVGHSIGDERTMKRQSDCVDLVESFKMTIHEAQREALHETALKVHFDLMVCPVLVRICYVLGE